MPGPLSCTDNDIRALLRTQAMIYAIREINQRTPRALPNLTLGYDIYDTCGDVNFAIRATLQLLKNQSDPQSCVISYYSTSELLSRKFKFPTFLRTVSSDEYQTKAIAKLVAEFNWKTVAIVASNDAYGKYGSDKLVDIFSNMKDVCIEFTVILPDDFSQSHFECHTRLAKLVSRINESSAEAVIVFTKESNVVVIMEAAIKYNLNRTWIASDAWSTSTTVSALSGIEMAGEIFGFTSKRNDVPGFKDYVISRFDGTTNSILEHYFTHYPLCSNQSEANRESDCSLTNSQQGSKRCLDPTCLANYIEKDLSYNIYLAVQVIVEGLRRLLKCDNHRCERSAKFTPLELLMEIKKVNFTVNTTHIFFDQNGDPSLGYEIVYWNMTESKKRTHIETIGEYWPDGKIKLSDDLVRKMRNVTVTVYNCSKTCQPGQQLKLQSKLCCDDCVPCADGEISAGNGEECTPCRSEQYSSPQKDKCFNKTVEFLRWRDHFIIFLSSMEVFGIIVTIMFAIVFTIYRSTPIVKAVGGYLCFLELFSLLACFCLTLSYVGKPTTASCMVRLPLFGIAFSLCISCILANLLQILVGFNFDLKLGSWIKKLNKPIAVVTIVFGIQLALCVSWLCFYPPRPSQVVSSRTILHQCEIGSTALLIAMLGYNSLLALICFLFAFKGRQLPDLYKNARLISISMLLFLIVWLFFIPIHLKLVGKEKQAIECAAILISSYSILGCHLAPKCHIMVFRKELNNENAITAYIKKHYEQRGMTVVKS
ncbi:G-protein coupled receptor family C group 6 member A-like [Sebastes fasciatus]|uniref:G-protein coupled receptor family C group 6 member A-like n=1 Tax=Sebastes fasciatus TaxID=394691 RepID=UPI003D9F4763